MRPKEVLRSLGGLVHRWFPKHDHVVLWGWPDHEDGILALERALQASSAKRVVLLVSDPRSAPPAPRGAKTTVVRKTSVRGVLWFLSARTVLFTHRCLVYEFPAGVDSVNLWHGMPIKRVGWMLDGDEVITSSYVTATSPTWARVMEEAWRPTQEVLVTGCPRNDRLFVDRADVWERLGLGERGDVSRLLMWMPTYRQSVRGTITVDGRSTGTPFEMDGVEPVALNSFLAERQAMLLVKPHPLADFEPGLMWSHLQVVDNGWFLDRSLSLYEALGAVDLLISDISGVMVDFLLLDRPIVHAMTDLAEYRSSRGFSIEPFEDHLMGPLASSFDQLLTTLDEVLAGGDPGAARRRAMRDLFHEDKDGRSSERLLMALGLLEAR